MKRLVAGFTLLLVLAGAPAAAFAHDEVTQTYPEAGYKGASPDRVELVFSEEMDPALVRVHLIGQDGTTETLTTSAGTEKNEIRAVVADALAPGLWTVEWGAVSSDGHPVSGSFSFTVIEGAAGTTIASTTTVETPETPTGGPSISATTTTPSENGPTDGKSLALIGGMVVLVLAGGGFALSAAKRQKFD